MEKSQDRLKVIENIRSAIENGKLNSKVEEGDPFVSQEDRDGFQKDVRKFIEDGLLSEVKSQMPDVWLDSLMEYDASFFEDVEETLAKEVE